ncbi:SpaH/EbpB family LPXTG-anchored major pilin [Arcanobacterium hippocoleae]|uniref:SpaH/EbpB family LPXTG-anchored major pilin n=1 Tax=Arcanobacterium hippocoleae TaxID=149017 RepID=UPI003340A193
MSIKKSRGVKALAVAVLTGLLSLTGVGAAHSQELPGAAQLDLANIKDSQTGEIVIHKYQNPVWQGKKADGKEVVKDQIPQGAIALQDVEFTIKQVQDIDLTKPEGWAEAKKYFNNIDGIEPQKLVDPKVQKTSANGEARFSNLALGLYLVEETDFTKAKANGELVKVTKGVNKFLVAVPYPSDEWLYTVHVYPKNAVNKDGEKIAQYAKNFKVGDELPWKVTLPIPALADGATEYTQFGMYDVFEAYLQYLAVKDVKVDDVPLDPQDYAVDDQVVRKDNKKAIHFSLTKTGLAKIKNKNNVTLIVNTKVTEIPENKIVENNFYPQTPTYDPYNNPGGEPGTPPPPTPGDKVYYGDIIGRKVDASNQKPLKDAVFAVYATREDAQNNQNEIKTATSNEKGKFTFDNLRIDSEKAPLQNGMKYYVKEKTAPAGYVLSDEIHEVTLTRTANHGTVGYTPVPSDMHDITNTKVTGPNLPLTGAQGKILLTIAGIAVLAFAGGVQIVSARRKRA